MSDAEETEISLSDGTTEIVFYGSRPDPTVAIDEWEFSDLVDWRGQTEPKSREDERPNAHGSFQTDSVWRSSRAISYGARFIGSSMARTRAAIDELSAMGAEAPVTIKVTEPEGATTRLVTVENVRPIDRRARQFASVTIDLFAADSRRYAVSAEVPWEQTGLASAGAGRTWPAVWPLVWPGGGSTGRIAVTNIGRAPAAPEFRLLGGFSSALITCVETGARIGFDRSVPVGSVVHLSVEDRRALLDSQADVSRWIRWREWELVPAGQTRTYQFEATDAVGTPKLEGRVLSAWW
jgi:hypothetical protein